MRKAITPIISIIILILIVLALVGGVWPFLSSYYGAMTSKVIQLGFGSEEGNMVRIINVGTAAIEPGDLIVLVNGEEGDILNPQTIEPEDSVVIIFYSPVYGENLNVKIIVPGNTITYTTNIDPIKILIIDDAGQPEYVDLSDPNKWGGNFVSLGFDVIVDTSVITKAEVDMYNPNIIACLGVFWSCANSKDLLKELYEAGYLIFTEGNDNGRFDSFLYPISENIQINFNENITDFIYPDMEVDHPISRGWEQASGSGGDARRGITTIKANYSIAKDTTHIYDYYEAFYLEETGKGKWYHHQPSRVAPDRLIINAIYYLKGYYI